MRMMMPSWTMLFNFTDVHSLAAWMIVLPLFGSLISGLFAKKVGKRGAHIVTVSCVSLSFVLAVFLCYQLMPNHASSVLFFDWLDGCAIGVLLDPLSLTMAVTVLFISLLVHIYSIGYMHDDSGYQRFFSYVSLFTFFMLALVMAPNLLQTFFGWEGVGVASYLLIGFWYTKPSAADGGLKAFLVNRFADIGLLIAIAVFYSVYTHLDITEIQHSVTLIRQYNIIIGYIQLPAINIIAWGLLLAAMGKSAQIPLHVWLPESMEGPTPISALIHAATMVTAGIYLMCRMSFIMIDVPSAQYALLLIGSMGAFLLACVGCVQHDIKRVVAYSTLSQLGYMMAACGAGLYPLAILHLLTHACFKALLFLSCGAVIVALHHEQDMRKMGGLVHKMPFMTFCFVMGALALVAFPGFSGFYSKDAIILSISQYSGFWSIPHVLLVMSAGLSALYIFRVIGLVFLGQPSKNNLAKIPLTMQVPIVILTIMSIFIGMILAPAFVGSDVLGPYVQLTSQSSGILSQFHEHLFKHLYGHLPYSIPFWLTIVGGYIALKYPVRSGEVFKSTLGGLVSKGFGFDYMIQKLTQTIQRFASICAWFDRYAVDHFWFMGLGRMTQRVSTYLLSRRLGQLNQNIFMMLLGLVILFLITRLLV